MKRIILTPLVALVVLYWPALVQSQKPARMAAAKTQKSGTTERRVIKTDKAPQSSSPISQAIVAGDLVFTSGQLGIDPKTGKMVAGGIEEQTEQVLLNLTAVLEAGASPPS